MSFFLKFVNPSLSAVLISAVLAGCGGGSTVEGQSPRSIETRSDISLVPTVTSTSPINFGEKTSTSTQNYDSMAVTGTVVTATFSQAMDAATITSDPAGVRTTFTLKETMGDAVPGIVTMSGDNKQAIFTPNAHALAANTQYTATVTTAAAAADANHAPLANAVTWSFTTSPIPFIARDPVNLGSAGSFAILTQTGITDVYKSAVKGDVGTSPITGAALLLSCDEVVGDIYTVDAGGPPCATTAPSKLTTAIGDMGFAYDDAAGRMFPDHTELGNGEIGGLTLTPGLYKWGTGVLISTDVTLIGGPTDVWIFQIAGTVGQASGTQVHLTGGALAKNVFWQSAGAVSIGTTAVFEGVMLAKTMVAVKTGATVNGRLLAQTAVTLQMNQVNQPLP